MLGAKKRQEQAAGFRQEQGHFRGFCLVHDYTPSQPLAMTEGCIDANSRFLGLNRGHICDGPPSSRAPVRLVEAQAASALQLFSMPIHVSLTPNRYFSRENHSLKCLTCKLISQSVSLEPNLQYSSSPITQSLKVHREL